MAKRFDIKEWQDSRTSISEDGGIYETTIRIQDSSGHFYVVISDSEGEKQSEEFDDIKLVYKYILDYLGQWDLN
jgi:hypothetical protein